MIHTDSTTVFAEYDILASLETHFENVTASDVPLTHTEITNLWDACWETWLTCDPKTHVDLGAFMAAIKAAYPDLPGKPSWVVLGDPEDF